MDVCTTSVSLPSKTGVDFFFDLVYGGGVSVNDIIQDNSK